nr:reverse transcriptase domain-containing protein [Tanacetum cinerariifolium]
MSESPKRASVFSRIRHDRLESPRHRPKGKGRRDGGVFNRLGRTPSRGAKTFLESDDNEGGHWKSRSKKQKSIIEDDGLSQLWVCEEIDPFTPRIRYFELPKKTRMPSNIKTYDGSDNPEDHLKNFQAAAKVEHWAMPTWCHMFNSTLTGSARVWFDDLPPESIDSYDDLKKSFLANYLQQKKCIKDLVEIHHIKQREESLQKILCKGSKMRVETLRKIQNAWESPDSCTRSPTLRSLNKVARQRITQSFSLDLEISFPPLGDEDGTSESLRHRREGKGRRDGGVFNRLGRTPSRGAKTFSESEDDEGGHWKSRSKKQKSSIEDDDLSQPWRQIKEFLKAGKLSHVINELKQGSGKDQPKAEKKGETFEKDKAVAILMVQPWQKVARQRITQSFSLDLEISFPPRGDEDETKGHVVIEAEIGGHFIHHIRKNQCGDSSGISRKTIAIGFTLTEEGRKALCELLRCNLDIFAWKPEDMMRVPRHLAKRHLNVREGCLPVRQKKKRQAPEKNKAIQEEVEKLVDTGVMKEVHYHRWLSNPAMVKKDDDTWRMCVDFKDLNKACLKDGYPLSKIDWKVESLSGYPFKCFLDAYKV